MPDIALFVFPGTEELDVVGPWEVLSWWAKYAPEDGYAVHTVGEAAGPVTCAKGLTISADRSIAEMGDPEVFIYPGGVGNRRFLADPAHLAWVRGLRAGIPLMASVCTGSLVYAAAGLLRGRPATTHWESLDRLAELDPTITVRADDRYVDDGDVVTASGVSAGIDMALHLVARLAGPERARQVKRGIQYDPAPPV